MSPNHPKGVFLIGTRRGVGTAHVAAALTHLLRARQLRTGVMLPVDTGVSDPTQISVRGALLHQAAAGQLETAMINPYRFRADADPVVAAELEQQKIDIHHLVDLAQQMIADHDFSVFAGCGGLMVPLAGGWLQADLAAALNLPLIIIADARSATVNDVLLNLYAAKNLDLVVAGYLLNRMPQATPEPAGQLPHSLAMLTGAELLGVIHEESVTAGEKVAAITDQLIHMPTRGLLENSLALERYS
ncbi:MAG: dethiobiotin synthase [Pelovirga sp.]